MTDIPSTVWGREIVFHRFTYTQFPKIFVYFLDYFGVYFLTRVFLAYFSRVICMQYGGFTRKKHACNAAIPAACAVRLNFN